MTPEEARHAALRKFGNIARVMERRATVWRWVWLEQLLQDVRYGLRLLRRNPRFTAVVVLTLALGIGVNTAVFSVVNTVLLKPLAYPHPERLVWLGTYDPRIGRDMVDMTEYTAWREQARSYDAMAAFGYLSRRSRRRRAPARSPECMASETSGRSPERSRCSAVSLEKTSRIASCSRGTCFNRNSRGIRRSSAQP